jgi:hypothetical protein
MIQINKFEERMTLKIQKIYFPITLEFAINIGILRG